MVARLLTPGLGIPRRIPNGELRAGQQRIPGRLDQPDFITDQYAVVYVAQGSGWFEDSAGTRWPLQPGCLFQRRPGEVHSVDARDVVAYYLAIPAAAYQALRLVGLTSLEQAVLQPGLDPRLMRRCDAAVTHLAESPEDELATCLAEIFQLIVDLHLRALRRQRDPADVAFTTRACAALSEHCCDRRALASIAKELGMGYAAFRKRFSQQLGMSPGAWRIRRRIERAQDLLADASLPIDTIAHRLGYCDVYAFSKQFREYTQRSPSRYRKEIG